MRRLVLGAVLLVAVVTGMLISAPAFQGYHIGYHWAAGDNVCMSRVFQWCKHEDTAP